MGPHSQGGSWTRQMPRWAEAARGSSSAPEPSARPPSPVAQSAPSEPPGRPSRHLEGAGVLSGAPAALAPSGPAPSETTPYWPPRSFPRASTTAGTRGVLDAIAPATAPSTAAILAGCFSKKPFRLIPIPLVAATFYYGPALHADHFAPNLSAEAPTRRANLAPPARGGVA